MAKDTLRLSRTDLIRIAEQGVLTQDQAHDLWYALRALHETRPKLGAAHVASYSGALLVMGALGWWMTRAWDALGGGGLFAIAVACGAVFGFAGWKLWRGRGGRISGGLLMTCAVSMTPLAVYGLERMLGIWPQGDPGAYPGFHLWIKGNWFLMEAATLLVGALVLRWVRFPFLTAPLAVTLWYMSMDLTPLLFGLRDFTWHQRSLVSMVFGGAMLAAAYLIDRRTRDDFAFWGYLFGLAAFWGGLSALDSASEWSKLGYCGVNVVLICLGVFLQRRVFLVFGGLGVMGYVGHLAYTLFKDSVLFPFALVVLGVCVLGAGYRFRKWQGATKEFTPSK